MKILLFGIGYWGKNHLELSNNDKVTSLIVVDPFFEAILI